MAKRQPPIADGRVFTDLTVIRQAVSNAKGEIRYECRCICGAIKPVAKHHLLSGAQVSCGCRKKRFPSHLKHGHTALATARTGRGRGTKEYRAWAEAISRCSRTKNKSFKRYGGRNIRVCEEWRHSFEAFLNHIGPAPTREHELDRIDYDGHYEPGNVRWATIIQQANNRSNNHWITYQGKTQTMAEWARELGLNQGTLSSRLGRLGWPVEKALQDLPASASISS